MIPLTTDPTDAGNTSAGNTSGELLLVVGVWRSGTSLLYALLNQHSQIALMYEGELALLWPLFRWRRGRSWLERWDLWNGAPTRHHLDAANFPADVRSLRVACDSAYSVVANAKHARFRGEKFPSHHDRLLVLGRLFPQARFVLIWRSPLGICDSIVRAGKTSPWNRKVGIEHRALFGCEQMLLGAKHLRAMGIPVHDLRYNDLASDTEAELRKICSFLAIDYESGMTDLGSADRSAAYTAEHHKLLHSDRVRAATSSGEALTPQFRRKIERYLTRWRRMYGNEWLADDATALDSGEPGWIELALDRIFYKALRMYDSAVVIAFCFAPMNLWKAYRQVKGG